MGGVGQIEMTAQLYGVSVAECCSEAFIAGIVWMRQSGNISGDEMLNAI